MSRQIYNSTAEFLIFTAQDQGNALEVRYEDQEIWLTQKIMAELFGVDVRTINEHLGNIFKSEELDETAVIRNFRITAADGKNYRVKHYNLDAVISVGYRVNSIRATQFRQWATQVLREFAQKGYVLDRQRMENGTFLGEDYFERLLEEIREIRLSERRFYQKITDIYATAVDYDKNAATSKAFFATVQNKLHYAVHGHTAAELIIQRADAEKPHMGLNTWAKSPDGKILASDVVTAKNYLSQDELQELGLIVSAFLDLAERRARRKIPMTMADWAERLDSFLQADDLSVLANAGTVSTQTAQDFARAEYAKFRPIQDKLFKNDFDKVLSQVEKIEKK